MNFLLSLLLFMMFLVVFLYLIIGDDDRCSVCLHIFTLFDNSSKLMVTLDHVNINNIMMQIELYDYLFDIGLDFRGGY